MLNIAKQQLLDGLLDAKFLIIAVLVLLAFVSNGFIYSQRYSLENQDWHDIVNKNTNDLSAASENLQRVAAVDQRVTRPISVLAFIADDGAVMMPNTVVVDPFWTRNLGRQSRVNDHIPLMPYLDWSFIVGTLMTLMTIMVSFGVVCGEKREGTLRLVLANSLARTSYFLGKYLGLLAVVLLVLMVGMLMSVIILVFSNALSFGAPVLLAAGWAFLLSALTLSLVLLFSLAVSSMTARPSVSFVVLMIFWVIIVVAVPGIGRLFGEQLVKVPSPMEIDQMMEDADRAAWANAGDNAGSYNGDPFAEFMPARCALRNDINTRQQRIFDDVFQKKSQQVKTVQTISSVSPVMLLSGALQHICNTGVYGYDTLIEYADNYRDQLHDFVVETDRRDPDTPHLVYYFNEQGTFSTKPVDVESIPRWHTMWAEGGLPQEKDWPVLQLLILLAINLQAAILAFIAISFYDPR